jgi:hypothetical protein
MLFFGSRIDEDIKQNLLQLPNYNFLTKSSIFVWSLIFQYTSILSHFTECLVLRATEYHVSGPTYRIIHAKIQNGFAFLDEIYQIMAPIPIAPHIT